MGKEADLDEVDAGGCHAFHGFSHHLRIHRGQVADGGADGPAPADRLDAYAHRCMIECAERAARRFLEVDQVGTAFERDQRFVQRAHAGKHHRHAAVSFLSPRNSSMRAFNQPQASSSRGPAVFSTPIVRYAISASIFSRCSMFKRLTRMAASITADCARLKPPKAPCAMCATSRQ